MGGFVVGFVIVFNEEDGFRIGMKGLDEVGFVFHCVLFVVSVPVIIASSIIQ